MSGCGCASGGGGAAVRPLAEAPPPSCSYAARCPTIDGKCRCGAEDAVPGTRCGCCCCCVCPCECGGGSDPPPPPGKKVPLSEAVVSGDAKATPEAFIPQPPPGDPPSCCSYRAQCPSIDGECACKSGDEDTEPCGCCCCCVCPCECVSPHPRVVEPSPTEPLEPVDSMTTRGHWEYQGGAGIGTSGQQVWSEGPAGEIPADSREPWGQSTPSAGTTEYLTHGCPPGTQFVANVGLIGNHWVSGCYPLPCPLPEGFRYAPGYENAACGPGTPAGWTPFPAGGDASTASPPGAVGFPAGPTPPVGWGPPTAPPGGALPLLPPPADDGYVPPPPDFGKSKYPLVPPPKEAGVEWPGAPDYLYVQIGNAEPCKGALPDFVPDAPIGYSLTGRIYYSTEWRSCGPSGANSRVITAFTFQYIDERLLAQQQPGQETPPRLPGIGEDDEAPWTQQEFPGPVVRPRPIVEDPGAVWGYTNLGELQCSTGSRIYIFPRTCPTTPPDVVVKRDSLGALRVSPRFGKQLSELNWIQSDDIDRALSKWATKARSAEDVARYSQVWAEFVLGPGPASLLLGWEVFVLLAEYLKGHGRTIWFNPEIALANSRTAMKKMRSAIEEAKRCAEAYWLRTDDDCFTLFRLDRGNDSVHEPTNPLIFLSLYNFYMGFEARVTVRRAGGPTAQDGWFSRVGEFTMHYFPILYDLYQFTPDDEVSDLLRLLGLDDEQMERYSLVGMAKPFVVQGIGDEQVHVWRYPRRGGSYADPGESMEAVRYIHHSELPGHLKLLDG